MARLYYMSIGLSRIMLYLYDTIPRGQSGDTAKYQLIATIFQLADSHVLINTLHSRTDSTGTPQRKSALRSKRALP